MGFEIEQPEEMDNGGGGKYADKPGIYHVIWTGVDENPITKDGKALDGVEVVMSILAGTNADQVGKSCDDMIWKVDHTRDQASQDRARRRQTAWATATCLIGQHQANAKTVVEPKDIIGRQSVVKLRFRQKADDAGVYHDTKRLEISFSDIFHVDDPWVERNSVPLDASAIALIPEALRKIQPGGGQMNGTAVAAAAAVAATGNGNGAATAAVATVDVGDV